MEPFLAMAQTLIGNNLGVFTVSHTFDHSLPPFQLSQWSERPKLQ